MEIGFSIKSGNQVSASSHFFANRQIIFKPYFKQIQAIIILILTLTQKLLSLNLREEDTFSEIEL